MSSERLTPERFAQIASRYTQLQIAIVGDFCLDRYLEIDPARGETSIETGLSVHNVVRVRSQPGAAGTVLNNLVALGVGGLWPIGFSGDDGEGFELRRALAGLAGVQLQHFVTTPLRRTFTYCKPLVMEASGPRELSRLDSKNWTPTPAEVEDGLLTGLRAAAERADAVIVMDQVDAAETGVVTGRVRQALTELQRAKPGRVILADCRRGLGSYPPLSFKMNAAELAAMTGQDTQSALGIGDVERISAEVARKNGQPVFVTLAERGIVGALASGQTAHAQSLPLRGPIDVVGAGDSVTANLTTALAAGAALSEALQIAMAAASLVVHQVGTTGTASPAEIAHLL
jgi:rfaE bifunctional protein kinase chain/domain